MVLVQADALLRRFQPRSQAVDLRAQGVLALAGRFEFLFDRLLRVSASRSAVSISLLHRVDLVAADAQPQRVGQPGVDHLGEAAQLPLDGLRLADQHGQGCGPPAAAGRRSSGRRPRRSVWSLRSMRPFRCSMRLGFHGTSKWNRFQQWAEVQTFAGGIGGDEDADRVLRRVGLLNAFLISSRSSCGVGPW